MMATDLIASKANCKLAHVPSGIAISAQPSVQIIGHMPLNWASKKTHTRSANDFLKGMRGYWIPENKKE